MNNYHIFLPFEHIEHALRVNQPITTPITPRYISNTYKQHYFNILHESTHKIGIHIICLIYLMQCSYVIIGSIIQEKLSSTSTRGLKNTSMPFLGALRVGIKIDNINNSNFIHFKHK